MGTKFNQATKKWDAFYSKRHPVTRQPVSIKRTGLKSEREAKRVLMELAAEMKERFHLAVVPTWAELVEKFHQDHLERDVSRKTVENYYLGLKKHTLKEWGALPADQINGQMIRELIREKLANSAESHRKNTLKHIKAVCRYAVEAGILKVDPTPSMKFRVGDKLKTVLTESQASRFLAAAENCGGEWYPIWAFALYTGMRSGELYALDWENVNLEDGRIRVNCSWSSKDGFKSPKSGHDRFVEIAPPLRCLLEELKTASGGVGPVLPRLDAWTKGEAARSLRMFLGGLGFPQIRFHDLRATWATILMGRGIAPIKVMKLGGWSDLKTMDRYVRQAGVDVAGSLSNFTLS